MGAGFTRRFNFVPGTAVITAIEGIVILDLPPPGNIAGVQTGVCCLVGEFSDSTYGVSVDNSANVTQVPNPVQIFSGADLLAKVGGFDSTIGDFGGSMGNGFVELRNKSFSQLILIPVPLSSSKAIRQWRKLPFNTSPTNANPVVPMQGAAVPAGYPYLNGSQQTNTAGPVAFTGLQPYISGTDGQITASVGSTEAFTSITGNFVNAAVAVGDVIVTGAPLITAIVSSATGAAYIGSLDPIISLAAPGWTGYPPSGGLLQIDSEFVTYLGTTAGASATTFTGVTRGVNNSVGATHAVGVIAVGMNNVDTYRINAVPGTTSLTLERQGGGNFSNSVGSYGASAVPWRVHKFTDAESAAGILANAAAYTVPARPLGPSGVNAATTLTPQTAPPAITYNTWNPLSGLSAITDPTTGLFYTPAVQVANAPSSSTMDALYSVALAATVAQSMPMASVNILWAARKSANIRSAINTQVNAESGIGTGRIGVIAPDLTSVTTTSQAIAAADPGVGGQRSERVFYTWPAVQTFVPEAVNINIKGADGKFYQNGIIDMPADGWLVSVLSNINPEWNYGQAGAPVPSILSPIAGLARNMPQNLGINDYIAFKANGVGALRQDRAVGFVFQSGVTTSLVSGQTEAARRRLADFIEDSIADATASLAKMPMTLLLQDNIVTEIDSFLNTLLSPDNAAAQRISGYLIDPVSGNTPALTAQGIFIVIVSVKKTPTADFIVYQFNIGNGVVLSTQNG